MADSATRVRPVRSGTFVLPSVDTIDEVPEHQLPSIMAELLSLQARVVARQTQAAAVVSEPGANHLLLTIDEASVHLRVTKDWLRRRPELPFIVKLSDGVVRYSARGIEQWVATRIRRGSLSS